MQLLDAAPEHDRVVISMHYIADYSQAQIADFLELPLTTVKKRLHDAKARLRSLMNDALRADVRRVRPARTDRFRDGVQLSVACISGDLRAARLLIERDPTLIGTYGQVEVDAMRRIGAHWGWTPLHLAAHYGHLEIVDLLIEQHADLEAKALNAIGNTPLGAAVWGDRLDVVERLIRAGADLNVKNNFGQAPLHRAVHRGAHRIARLLIASGADPELVEKYLDWPSVFCPDVIPNEDAPPSAQEAGPAKPHHPFDRRLGRFTLRVITLRLHNHRASRARRWSRALICSVRLIISF
jgi:hypothetical protein